MLETKLLQQRYGRPRSLATELQELGIRFGQRLDVLEIVAFLADANGLLGVRRRAVIQSG